MKYNLLFCALSSMILSAQSFASQQSISNDDSSVSPEGKCQTDVCSTVRGCNYMLQSLMSEYKKVQHRNEELLKENAKLKKDKESPVAKQVVVCGDNAVDMLPAHRRSHGDETPEQRKERKNKEGHTVY